MPSPTFIRTVFALGALGLASSLLGDAEASLAAALPAPQPRAWPGPAAVHTVDAPGTFGGNLSGLAYQPRTERSAAVLWAVRNRPASLYALRWDGASWRPDPRASWTLRYPNGAGEPDAEGLTLA
ncbi:MAG TPA: hypothetical protein VJR89_18190, partial [Polyangiales bacterium]|nr:hypothetical protein [Polyangiales bacterium]